MADGFQPRASQQNPRQFLARNPFTPSDFRMVHPSYPPSNVDTRMGHFHAGQTQNFGPRFTKMHEGTSSQARDPYTYNQNLKGQSCFTTNQGDMRQHINTFPNTNSAAAFRPRGNISPSVYVDRTRDYLTPFVSVAGPPITRSTSFVARAEPGKFAMASHGNHITNCPVSAPCEVRAGSAGFFHNVATTGDVTTALSDKNWVERFVQERHIVKPEQDQKSRLKICEAKELLRRWFCLTAELINERDKLIECIRMDKSEWDTQLHQAVQVKEKIAKIEATFTNPLIMEKLEKQISTRRKKRVNQETRRKRRVAERTEAEERRSLLHKKIDGWKEKAIAKDEALRKAALLKSEAGGVLGEVRRKLSETTKGLELLKSLKKLRDIRKQEAEQKGVYRRPTEGENKYFSERLEYMNKLMTKRKTLYEVEQKALEVMLTEEEEEKYRKKREERRIQRDLFEAKDPMEDFCNYYNQADQSLQSLLQIRHQWDIFLVPDNVPGASRIPEGWVVPARPSSELWASTVRRHETGNS